VIRMYKVLSLLVCATLIAVVCAQVRPVIPEVFEARLGFEVLEQGERQPIIGQGVWAANQPKGQQLEMFHFAVERHPLEVYRLQRFDMNATYELDNFNRTSCNKTKLSGGMPQNWAWVKQATYMGKFVLREKTLAMWQFSTGFATMELVVDPNVPNVPIYLRRNSTKEALGMFFEGFLTTPNEGLFAVPNFCSNATFPQFVPAQSSSAVLQCRDRPTMIAVGNAWFNAKVPYNQGATYQGYREDCSGFVSAAWAASQPGPDTMEFPTIAHAIGKDDLQPGDCLLYAAEHVVLFGGWTSAAKTEYTAYEETKPGEGMAKRATPYPYWYSQSSFLPYRYNAAC